MANLEQNLDELIDKVGEDVVNDLLEQTLTRLYDGEKPSDLIVENINQIQRLCVHKCRR